MAILKIEYIRHDTFEAAAAAAGTGYNDPGQLAGYSKEPYLTPRPNLGEIQEYFAPAMASMGIVSLRTSKRVVRVMDFGGHLGVHCAYLQGAFNRALDFDWNVVETPVIVEYGRRMIKDPEIKFWTAIDEIPGDLDVAYFSGVLGYIPGWDDVLAHPKVANAEFIVVLRTTVGDTEQPYLKRVTYDDKEVCYPGRILAKQALNDALSKTHEIVVGWDIWHTLLDAKLHAAPSMIWQKKR